MKLIIVAAQLLVIFCTSQIVESQHFAVSIPCTSDEGCRRTPHVSSSAICKNGFCICNEGGVSKNCSVPTTMLTSTKILVAIGRECKHPVDCKVENSYCNSTMSQCLCKRDFVSNIKGNKCLPVVNSIGGTCEDSKQCLAHLSNTICSNYQCVCTNGFHYANKMCFKNSGIGETCQSTQECSHIEHAECNQNNICVCSLDSVASADNKRCLPLARELSQQCTESAQCTATLSINAECIGNHCQCTSSAHFVARNHKCVISKSVDEACDDDDDCYQGELPDSNIVMTCNSKICTCADGYMKNEKKCVASSASATMSKISVGLLLICLLIFSRSETRIKNKKSKKRRSRGRRRRKEGEEEEEEAEEEADKSEIHKEKGKGKVEKESIVRSGSWQKEPRNHRESQRVTIVLLTMPQNTLNHLQVVIIILTIIVTIFESALPSSEIIILQKQRISQTLMNCSYNRDCPDNAYCHNHECSCEAGFLLSSNKIELQCLRIATNLRDPCREDDQCRVTFTVQAECRDNVCVCSDGSHYDERQRRCYQSVGIGQMCKTEYNCHVEGSPSFCVEGYCSCPIAHHPSRDGKSCLKSLSLGEYCINDDECITQNSTCYGTCICQDGYTSSDDKKKCLKAANSIGDFCEEDSQCKAFLKNAKCGEENKCTCIIDFKRRGSICLRKINPEMIGKSCSSRSQCVKPMPETDLNKEEVVNIDCLNGKCSCAQDYILTEDNTDCIRYSENGAVKTMATWFMSISIASTLINII
ncbi:hypothetical protein PV326_013503 [Microctonus aethiopoides]|nr:hypothetical protein PV326_013503 [Microctonus aethiopoides]